jgi:hypothetical protein
MKIDGRCHCGSVTFQAEADPETTTICNCTDCQTMSGAPLRAVIMTRPGTFVFLSGKPTEYRKTPDSGAVRPQGFCPRCGTALYSTSDGGAKCRRDCDPRCGCDRQDYSFGHNRARMRCEECYNPAEPPAARKERAMAKGILVPVVDFAGMAEDEFNDWYDLEHIPERLRVPGFLTCERWIDTDNQKISVATYDLDNANVLKSEAYNVIGNHAAGGDNLSVWSRRVTARIKIRMRFEGEQIATGGDVARKDAPVLLLNAMSVAPEQEHEFNHWYNAECIPGRLAVPGMLCACCYRGIDAAAHRYLALYYLTSAEIPHSTTWKAADNTPWAERIHFRNDLWIVSQRYQRAP